MSCAQAYCIGSSQSIEIYVTNRINWLDFSIEMSNQIILLVAQLYGLAWSDAVRLRIRHSNRLIDDGGAWPAQGSLPISRIVRKNSFLGKKSSVATNFLQPIACLNYNTLLGSWRLGSLYAGRIVWYQKNGLDHSTRRRHRDIQKRHTEIARQTDRQRG